MLGLADTFADYSDLRAYINARDNLGKSPEEALAYGDNGVGEWGAITAQTHTPMVAICPEHLDGQVHGARVLVINHNNGKQVTAIYDDARPHYAHIPDGSLIELNPAACDALGITPPDSPANIEWHFL